MSLTAYQTGTASDPADLLSKLAAFAAANGWTAATPASGRVLSKGNIYVGMNTDADELFMRGCLSYSAGSAWDAQPNNAAVTMAINLGAGPYTAYHFFVGAEGGKDYLHAAVEIAASIYRHFVIGSLIQSGSYTGGTYVDGVRWSASTLYMNVPASSQHAAICDAPSSVGNGHIWIDYDSKTDNWQREGAYNDFATNKFVGNHRGEGILDVPDGVIGYQRYNLRTPLWPAQYFVNRASNLRSLAGRIPDFRLVHMKNFVPGDILSIGGVDWMIFPTCQKTDTWGSGSSSVPSSGYYAYAYRKN